MFLRVAVAAALSVSAKHRSRLRHAARGDTELPLSNAFSYYKRELESNPPPSPRGCVVETRGA